MSGSLGGLALDSSIPLRAGQGVTPLQNPLDMLGKAVSIKNALNTGQIQQQTIQSNQLSLAQQQKALAYAHILPAVLGGRINNMADVTSYMAGLEHYGINTQPFLADVAQTAAQGGNFVDNLKAAALSGVQPPEKAAGAILPTRTNLPVGGQVLPLTEGAPGMPGYGNPVQSGPGFQMGYTPNEGLATTTRPATQDDVNKSNGRLVLGQPVSVPTTTIVAPYTNPGAGGARIPAGSLGPGGYQAPRRPLDQLGAPYRPAAPAPAPMIPGAKLMKGPGGSFWVPPDKVATFQQNGYQ